MFASSQQCLWHLAKALTPSWPALREDTQAGAKGPASGIVPSTEKGLEFIDISERGEGLPDFLVFAAPNKRPPAINALLTSLEASSSADLFWRTLDTAIKEELITPEEIFVSPLGSRADVESLATL